MFFNAVFGVKIHPRMIHRLMAGGDGIHPDELTVLPTRGREIPLPPIREWVYLYSIPENDGGYITLFFYRKGARPTAGGTRLMAHIQDPGDWGEQEAPAERGNED